jgi:hypothetical protein
LKAVLKLALPPLPPPLRPLSLSQNGEGECELYGDKHSLKPVEPSPPFESEPVSNDICSCTCSGAGAGLRAHPFNRAITFDGE